MSLGNHVCVYKVIYEPREPCVCVCMRSCMSLGNHVCVCV
jgi:hypothetical protein